MSQQVRAIGRVASPVKVILTLLLIALFSCKKDSSLNLRVLQPGTKVSVVSNVFGEGDKQPAEPMTITSIFRGASSGLIFYNVTDANGVVWQLPDNDLQVVK